MIDAIRYWLRERKATRRQFESYAGYGWAMATYMMEGQSADEIEAQIYGSSDSFDIGAARALIDIAEYKMVPHGGSYYGPQSHK